MKSNRVLNKVICQVAFSFFLLTSCGSPAAVPPTGMVSQVPPLDVVEDVPRDNLARGKQVTASDFVLGYMPLYAVDGLTSTVWSSGAVPEQWIQIDLGAPATIESIRLQVSQAQAGKTTHRVLAGASPENLYLMHEFSGDTRDGQVLEYTTLLPLSNIRYIRIVTIESPSQVAWSEIQAFGSLSESTAAVASDPVADIIYHNARILTMEPGFPLAQAIAIQDDRILAVGDRESVLAYQGDSTETIDLHGLTMTPGFIDSHEHRVGDRWQYGNPPVAQVFYEILAEGWTSIHELWVDGPRLDELVAFAAGDGLPVRVSVYLKMNSEYTLDDWWQAYEPLHQYSPYLQIAGLKITLDREWGQMVFLDQSQLNTTVLEAYSRGWQVATHSFSPAANALILNAYAHALDGASNDSARFRLEHLGVMTDAQVDQMAALGIIGSVQFINAGSLPDDASFKTYIPGEQWVLSARWRDLIDAGVFLIGNTDAPWCCTDWRNEFKGPSFIPSVPASIYQGVTRRTFTNRQPEPWQLAQVVTVQEALEMLTIRGAYAAHQENVIGSLAPGKYADLVVLSEDPLTIPVEGLPNSKVVMTMVGGEIKFCASGFDTVCAATTSP